MKKLLLVLLALAMCVSICACGSGSATIESSSQNSNPDQSTVAEDDSNSKNKTEPEISEVSDNTEQLEAESDQVEQLISAIKNPELISEKSNIDAARKAYDALSDEAKELVDNYDVLTNAETVNSAVLEAEKGKINTYKANFDADVDKVEGLTWYMHKKMPDYIDTRSYIIPYIGVKNDNAWICIRYNYTEDDWVFWENLTIVSDGQKYYKYVGAFDTVRDNGGGVVWEFYDEVLDYNEPMDSSSIEMLRTIADSDETIIRFQGDDYYYDLTVTSADKAMIKDVLDLYQALLID